MAAASLKSSKVESRGVNTCNYPKQSVPAGESEVSVILWVETAADTLV